MQSTARKILFTRSGVVLGQVGALAALGLAALGLVSAAGCGTPLDACPDSFACPPETFGAPDGSGGSGGEGMGGMGSLAGGGDGGTGGVPGEGCKSAADCPGPAAKECGEAQCLDGVCSLDFRPFGEVSSQIRGDCSTSYCDGAGAIITLPDGLDSYNDGRQCTIDHCKAGDAGEVLVVNLPFPDGSPCPETGIGVCFQGSCVACIATLPFANDCGVDYACDDVRCVPGHCVNKAYDPNDGETDKDCGGLCSPCAVSEGCLKNSDCMDGVCVSGKCSPPSCSDGVVNDGETGIDCGGLPSCKRCSAGEGCDFGADCSSEVCWAGVCEPPTCNDGTRNGDELNIDCGGSCPACP